MPRGLVPMAATTGELPRDDAAYSFEIKWDGVRALTYIEGGQFHMESRNRKDISMRYPEVWPIVDALGGREAILDGEVVAFDDTGRPSFGVLQGRMHLANAGEIQRRMVETPVMYVLFDVLWLDGESKMELPYHARREVLEQLAVNGAAWRTSPTQIGDGADLLQAAKQQDLEGVMAKRRESKYVPDSRTREWIKIKSRRRQELVIGGWTPGEGSRDGRIGSLLLGYYDDAGALRYAGRVGSGFPEAVLRQLAAALGPLEQPESPFADPVPYKGDHWVKPQLVGEVEFSEWTSEGVIRQAAFKGLRSDKDPRHVIREP